MARNDDTNRSRQGSTQHSQHRTSTTRDRRRDQVLNTVKERPYAAAALATVAAGAAAFFLTRGKSDKPLMNWGQESQSDRLKDAGAYKQQGSTASDRSLETAAASPGSSAGTGAGSPSAIQAASLSKTGTSTSSSSIGSSNSNAQTGGTSSAGSSDNRNTGTSNTTGAGVIGGSNASGGGATSDTGLDKEAKTEAKVGAISYGA